MTLTGRQRASMFLLVILAGLGCRPAPPAPGPMASMLVGMAAELGDAPADVARAWGVLEDIAARVDKRLRQGGHGRDAHATVETLNSVVFDELGFEREITRDDPRFFRLSTVLEARRGSCVGLGVLYLAVAERLGVRLDGIMVPGHFFVRVPARAQTPARNVELLRRGEAMPDAWYRSKYGLWPEDGREYFRPLTVEEVEAVHWFNLGNHLRATEAPLEAEKAYQRAVAAFPNFAEAHASLGAVRQLVGQVGRAAEAYSAAARIRPDLPGLTGNVERLNQRRETR
jgi:regulator of sirC expression with transglutaminase-like and TPR domain